MRSCYLTFCSTFWFMTHQLPKTNVRNVPTSVRPGSTNGEGETAGLHACSGSAATSQTFFPVSTRRHTCIPHIRQSWMSVPDKHRRPYVHVAANNGHKTANPTATSGKQNYNSGQLDILLCRAIVHGVHKKMHMASRNVAATSSCYSFRRLGQRKLSNLPSAPPLPHPRDEDDALLIKAH